MTAVIPLHAVPGRRFKPSGPNIPESARNTEVLKVRCAPELAKEARAFCAAKGLTLAEVIAAGLASLNENPKE